MNLADQLQAGSDRIREEWREEADAKEMAEEAATLPASRERVRAALEVGGLALITVRSKTTGTHVTLRFAGKKKDADDQWVSRAKEEGRVGLKEGAAALFVDDPDLDWPHSSVGAFWTGTGEWRPKRNADSARAWAAQHVLTWALSSYALEEQADVMISVRCSVCGHRLRDPESIERGVGPECYGKRTGSRMAGRAS